MASSVMKMAFVINGSLGRDFTSSLGRAQKQIQNMNAAIQKANNAYSTARRLRAKATSDSGIQLYEKRIDSLKNKIEQTTRSLKVMTDLLNRRNQTKKLFDTAKIDFLSNLAVVRPVASFFTDAYESAASFEKAMSKVGAIALGNEKGEEYNRQLQLLTETARKLGEKTQFTATQSAEAMSYLGMAGWKTNQIIEGMPALLDLAVAGGADLARTADIISDELTAFGLGADKARHMADVFAVTITSTNTDVEKLGETMKYAAPVAYAFGASMEETAAMAGLMAGKAIKASQAGTSLRTGLMRLAGPPKMAQKAMDELGLSMEDLTAEQKEAAMALKTLGIETGNTAGAQKMAIILNSLREKMAGLTKEEKTAMAAAVFGKNAAAGWLAMIDAEEGAFEKLLDSLYKSEGASARVAARMNANAKGAAMRMKSAYESLQISLMNNFLPTIASAFEWLAKLTGTVSKLAGEYPGLTKAIVGTVAAATGLFVLFSGANLVYHFYHFAHAGALLWLKGIQGCTRALQLQAFATTALSTVTKVLGAAFGFVNSIFAATPIGWIIIGITALIVAGTLLYKHWDKVKTFFTNLWNNPTARLLMFITGPVGLMVGAVTAIIANWDTLKEYFEYFWDNPEAALFRFQNWVQESFKNAVEAGRKKWDELKAWLDKPIFATFIAPAWDSFKKSAMAAFENVKARAGAAFDGVKASITGAVNSAVETVKNLPETIAGAAGFAAGYLFEMLSQMPSRIGAFVTSAGEFLRNLPRYCYEAGASFITNLAAWGTNAYNTLTSTIGRMVNSVYEVLSNLPEICLQAGTAFLNRLITWSTEAFGETVAFLIKLNTSAMTFLWNLPKICMEAGQRFVSAAGKWAMDAYNSIMEWILKLPDAISNTISNAWEGIKSKFSAGFTVGVSAAQTAAPVAANAKGGIYNRGAFLTTFAEKSPEAAIPIDSSDRAKGLWLSVGRMLGMVQTPQGRIGYDRKPSLPNITPIMQTMADIPSISLPDLPAQKETLVERIKEFVTSAPARNNQSAPTFVVNNEFHFTGQANESEIRDAVNKATDITAAKFRELMQQYLREERRLSYG